MAGSGSLEQRTNRLHLAAVIVPTFMLGAATGSVIIGDPYFDFFAFLASGFLGSAVIKSYDNAKYPFSEEGAEIGAVSYAAGWLVGRVAGPPLYLFLTYG